MPASRASETKGLEFVKATKPDKAGQDRTEDALGKKNEEPTRETVAFVWNDPRSQELLAQALRREIERDPLRALKTYFLPLLLKQRAASLATEEEDMARVHRLLQELAIKIHGSAGGDE